MLTISLPTDTTHYTIDVRLDGTVYALDLDWNERAGIWFLGIYLPTADDRAPLMLTCPCVVGIPLTLGLVDPRWAGGHLLVSGAVDPGREGWGSEADLVYLTHAEVAATVAS